MSITFTVNGKQVQLKSNETFWYLFEEHIKDGKFQDKVWRINDQPKMIQKNIKINQFLQGGERVDCLDKNQPIIFKPVPIPIFPKPVDQREFNPIPPPPFPFPIIIQPVSPIKPAIVRLQIDDTTGQRESVLKSIKGFKVQIKEYGKLVTLESDDGSFKATFLEENASESEQENIVLTSNDIVLSPDTQLKLAMGKNPQQSTKVLFLSGFKGIAIKWVTGLQTKFQFLLDE